MDVFTNALEGVRQYFQGLPAATGPSAGPAYDQPNVAAVESSGGVSYWPPQPEPQQSGPASSRGEEIPPQRPPDQHDVKSSYVGAATPYHESAPPPPPAFQFSVPQSREAPYQSHIIPNPSYQSGRISSRQQQQDMTMMTTMPTTTQTTTQSYHQLQPAAQQNPYGGGYHQNRSYYPLQSQPAKLQQQLQPINNVYNNNNKVAVSNQSYNNYDAYNNKSSYVPATAYATIKPVTSSHNQEIKQQQDQKQHRTTHNLPPIAALSVNYHTNRSNREAIRATNSSSSNRKPMSSTMSSSTTAAAQITSKPVRGGGPYENNTNYRNPPPPPPQYVPANPNQNYGYSPAVASTTSAGNYSTPYYPSSTHHHQNVQVSIKPCNNRDAAHGTTPSQYRPIANHCVTAVPTVDSVLDLSLKTIKTPADSTLDDPDDPQRNNKYYHHQVRGYPQDTSYNSFQRIPTTSTRQQQQPTATAPKFDFLPNFNVPSLNQNNRNTAAAAALAYEQQKNAYQQQQRFHVPPVQNVYQPTKKPVVVDGLPRVDFPPTNQAHKAVYLGQQQQQQVEMQQRKRVVGDPVPATTPTKKSKVDDRWRVAIDQQIEQKFSSYQSRVQDVGVKSKSHLNGNFMPTSNQQQQQQPNTYQYPMQYPNQYHHHQVDHNQTYVPSAVPHHYPPPQQQQFYQQQQQQAQRSNLQQPSNRSHGADKRIISILRTNLEMKGAKEAQKKIEQNTSQFKPYEVAAAAAYAQQQRPREIQHPSTDVTAPLQPKLGIVGRHNVSPFTASSLLDTPPTYKFPKAVDSIRYELDSDKQIVDRPLLLTDNSDLDGLAANLAARIRTKAELKQVNADLPPLNGSAPPKSQYPPPPPRNRLFSKSEEDGGVLPMMRNTGLRSSSETSVFDFPDSDSDTEMPVLERQSLEAMRRDRKSVSKQSLVNESDFKDEAKPLDDVFDLACDNFVEQLKKGGGKKRGRRKKVMEADVLAKLESVTREKPLDQTVVTVKIEAPTPPPPPPPPKPERPIVIDPPKETIEVVVEPKPIKVEEDSDSDVPLIKCKTKTTAKPPVSNDDNEDDLIKKEVSGARRKLDSSDDSSESEPERRGREKQMRRKIREHLRKNLSSSLNELSKTPIKRGQKKPTFGDGSDFYPGWEEELCKYKKSLRMPPTLIHVTRPPHFHRLSTSLPDLDPYPASPTPSSVTDNADYCKFKTKTKSENFDSDMDSNSSFNFSFTKTNYDSEEGSSSVKSLNISNRSRDSILDRLLERYGGKRRKKLKKTDDKTASPKKSTRTEARVLKQKATIREVFGEDRPASAPPVTCVDDLKGQKSPDDDVKKPELKSTKEVLKNKLLSRGRKARDLLKALATKKFETEYEDDGESKPDFVDCKSETPSLDGDESNLSTAGKKRIKLRNVRRKGSSGFDYIRKKKKQVKKESVENDAAGKPKRRGTIPKASPESVQDIQKEIKMWVLNKGIGETHLHRAARLGYTDITAYCLEKMECQPSPKDNAGYTPLHEACSRGHLNIAKLLLLYGANASDSAQGGIRPLHEAAENGFVEIVRLLLSYGADPMLATYSGSTPLSLAVEESTQTLLTNHIADINRQMSVPWSFQGPASCFDADESGYDPISSPPAPDPVSEEEDMEFEVSDLQLPNLYTIRGESQTDRWVLLQDLSNMLKIKSRDALLKQINPPSAHGSCSSTPRNVLRELKMTDFLEQARCCQFMNASEKINTRASKIALVRYTDKVRQLLNVEKVLITAAVAR